MKEQFAPYEIALKLKELGFNEECLAWYYYDEEDNTAQLCYQREVYVNYINAPLWQQAIDFLFEKYDVYIDIRYEHEWNYRIYSTKTLDIIFIQNIGQIRNNSKDFKTVREQAILKAITLISK
jgi:hypothetical protein